MNALKVGRLFRVTNGIIVLIVSTSEMCAYCISWHELDCTIVDWRTSRMLPLSLDDWTQLR